MRTVHRRRALIASATLALVFAASATASATTAPPTPSPATTTVASALTNPRGFTWNPDTGAIVVALAGSGGTSAPTENTPTNAVIGPITGGLTAAVASISPDTCPAALVQGLPSALTATGEVLGADDVAYIGSELYIGVDGGGAGHGNPDNPSGIYHSLGNGTAELVVDLSAWTRANPVAVVPGDSDPDAGGYSIVTEPSSGTLYVGDPNSGQILNITTDGTVTRVADLSDPHMVPTRLALDPDGGVYVGTLTAVPFTDGTAQVWHIDTDGTATVVWTGLTAVVDVAVGPDGSLYALELATGNLTAPPFLQPMTGALVHQTGPDTSEVVASGLNLPIAMELGDGAFYVSTPAAGANDGSGSIISFPGPAAPAPADTSVGTEAAVATTAAPATTAMTADTAAMATDAATATTAAPAECYPVYGTTGPASVTPPSSEAPTGSAPAPAPSAAPVASEAPATTAAAPAPSAAPGSDAAGAAAITIQDFTFTPADLSVAVGTTITITNNDSTAHTVTADDGSFDTGSIDPGASTTLTLDTAGTFAFHCTFHPNMMGTITVA